MATVEGGRLARAADSVGSAVFLSVFVAGYALLKSWWAIGAVFIVLKLANAVNWSWPEVLSPIMFFAAALVAAIIADYVADRLWD